MAGKTASGGAGAGKFGARERLVWMCLLVGVSLAIPAFLLVGVPRFEAWFMDFGVQLPRATRIEINAARWLRGDRVGQSIPGAIWLAPVCLAVVATVLTVPWAADGRAGRRRAVALLAVLLLVLAMVVAPMLLPVPTMRDSLRGGSL